MTLKRLLSKSISSSLHNDGEAQTRVIDLGIGDVFDDLSGAGEWLSVKWR